MMIEGTKAPPLPDGERVAAQRPGEGAAADPTKRSAGSTDRARTLRANDTEPEFRLWGELRNRLLNGHKFARQVPLGSYVVDFVCRREKLVIEVDGSQHAASPRDVRRDAWLNAQSYAILRFWNHEILRERRDVLETVLAALEGATASLNTPTPSPTPPEGGVS